MWRLIPHSNCTNGCYDKPDRTSNQGMLHGISRGKFGCDIRTKCSIDTTVQDNEGNKSESSLTQKVVAWIHVLINNKSVVIERIKTTINPVIIAPILFSTALFVCGSLVFCRAIHHPVYSKLVRKATKISTPKHILQWH